MKWYRIDSAYTWLVGNQFMKTRFSVGEYDDLVTATGILVRDNLNRMEDRSKVVEEINSLLSQRLEAEKEKPVAERDKDLIKQVGAAVEETDEMLRALRKYLLNEKLYLKRLYPLYNEPDYIF